MSTIANAYTSITIAVRRLRDCVWRTFYTPARGSAIILLIFYTWFIPHIAGGLTSWFSDDDLQNLHYYWDRSWLSVVLGNVLFFTDYYRPLGGFIYKLFFSLFGMETLPERLFVFALCLINVWLLYTLAQRLSRSTEILTITLLLVGFHASFINIYYDTGMIYDVLAFASYAGAFGLYISIRPKRDLTTTESAVFAVLLVCALNSKEIAASLPVAVIVYEFLWNGRLFSGRQPVGLSCWKEHWWRLDLTAVAVTTLWAIGKLIGGDSLTRQAGYQPHFTLSTYLDVYRRYLMQLCYEEVAISKHWMLALIVIVVIASLMLKNRYLIFNGIMIVVCPLPIAFIPARAGFAFYLPAIFLAMWVAGFLSLLRRIIVARLGARLRLSGERVRRVGIFSSVVLCGAIGVYVIRLHERMWRFPLPLAQVLQDRNKAYAKQIHDAVPRMPHGARILVVDDPYNGYQMLFLIQLLYNDKTLVIDQTGIRRHLGLPSDPLAYDYVFRFVAGRIMVSHRGGSPASAPVAL